MDRGDTGFILHESFKDLKTRRAEQEAYRRALEEQIMQKRKLEEQERRKYEGRRHPNDMASPATQHQRHIQPTTPNLLYPLPPTPESHKTHDDSNNLPTHVLPPIETPSPYNQPTSIGVALNEIDSFNEPHPAALAPKADTVSTCSAPPNLPPEFSPECLKYLQQVMPGFQLSSHLSAPVTDPSIHGPKDNPIVHAAENVPTEPPRENESLDISPYDMDLSVPDKPSMAQSGFEKPSKFKIHVSQTSEQLEAVKVTQEQYKEELKRQIIERKNREEELRLQAEQEEARIQEKIRMEQEKMQKEYEEELRKQKEREKEEERIRALTIAKLKETIEIVNEKAGCKSKSRSNQQEKIERESEFRDSCQASQTATPSCSEESIESIGDFFDETMEPRIHKANADYDERVIPVIAKKIREQALKREKLTEDESEYEGSQTFRSLTARVSKTFADDCSKPCQSAPADDGPSASVPHIPREIAIRSAPCPQTRHSESLEFLSTLKDYLQTEKKKLDQQIKARTSKSTEQF